MVEIAEIFEMVCSFNNFKAFVMFAVKKLETLLMLFGKIFFTSKYRIHHILKKIHILLSMHE
jgi:hypothetical protein